MTHEMIIMDGTVIDGTGSRGVKADILVKNGRITHVGEASPSAQAKRINAAGLTIAPGFIDAHTHAEFILSSPRCGAYIEPFVRQGITTMITGNCGVSAAPVADHTREFLRSYWDSLLPQEGLAFGWSSMADFFTHLQQQKIPVNMAQFAGHGTLRLNVMGCRSGAPSNTEKKAMQQQLRESLEAGAMGISYGLTYVPGIWADTDELRDVGKALKTYNGRITVHLRSQTDFFEQAVLEIIHIAEVLGAPLQISHYTPYSIEYLESFFKTLDHIEKAVSRGVDIGCDMLTPPVSSTTVCHLFPAWMFDGGFSLFLERLADPGLRARIRDDLKRKPVWPSWKDGSWADNMCSYQDERKNPIWMNMRLNGFRNPENLAFEFQSIDEISQHLDMDPYDALFELTLAEKGRLFFTGFSQKSLDLDDLDMAAAPILQLPGCAMMTDSVGIGRGSRAATIYSTFPRVIGRHVREWGTFTLEEAIRKCTSLPAAQYGLKDRGVICENAAADLVIFDADKVTDNATFDRPFQYPDGIKTVMINGAFVWHEGKYDEKKMAGQVITHQTK